MYCEKCGKQLEEGEICSCQKDTGRENEKKKIKIRINIYMLISLLLFIFGVEMFLYFYIGAENFLEILPIDFVNANKGYFSCGIIMLIFAGGIAGGVFAIKYQVAKRASIIIFALNLIGLLVACGVLGVTVYQNHKSGSSVINEEVENEGQTTEDTLENGQESTVETNGTGENTEFVQSVLAQADSLIQQGDIDKAKNVLSDAYAVTNSEEIQKKLNEMNGQGNSGEAETPVEEVFGSPEETENSSEIQTQDTGIHRYEMVLSDGTWEEAYRACAAKGGHLVTFESQEEFLYVSSLLIDNGQQNNIFFIGGRRDLDSQNYYWVDKNNNLTGSVLNASDGWSAGNWLTNEPSFKDSSLGIDEHVLSIFFYADADKWVWNDVPNNLISAVPSYSGKMGYICEYEN